MDAFLVGRGQSLEKPVEIRDSHMIGLLLRRECTGRKTWHYGYSFQGRRGRAKVGNSPALDVNAARKAAKVLAAQVALGIDPVAERRKQRKEYAGEHTSPVYRLGTFVEGRYARWARAHLKSHRETLAALKADFGNSRRKTCKRGAGWWRRRMDAITEANLDLWQTSELRRGNKPSTINRAWQRLRAVLGKAVEWKIIGSPLPGLKKLRVDRRGRVRFLSLEERQRLFHALEEREGQRREKRSRYNGWRLVRHQRAMPAFERIVFTDCLQPLTRMWLGTGLRRKETFSLCWRDLDLALGFVNLPGGITKNWQSRSVPMPTDLTRCLLIWRAQHPDDKPDDLVFRSGRDQRLRSVSKSWKALMQLAQIADFRIHDCRHDYASRLAMADASLKTIAELLGHQDLTQVQRYAHLSDKHLRDSVLRLKADPTPWSVAEFSPTPTPARPPPQ
jgi:integrase